MARKPSKREPEPPARRESRVSVGLGAGPGAPPAPPERGTERPRPEITIGMTFTTKPPARESAQIPREEIAARAYTIWDRNGRPDGTADRDWLQAEAELRAERAGGHGPAPADSPGPPADGRPVIVLPPRPGAGEARPAKPRAGAGRGTVRLSGNVRRVTKSEWLGAPEVDAEGHIARSADLPEEVYLHIERAIAGGSIEGMVFLDSQRRVEWLLDR